MFGDAVTVPPFVTLLLYPNCDDVGVYVVVGNPIPLGKVELYIDMA